MNYAQAVTKGKALLARSETDQWELAELTYEVTTGKKPETIVKWAGDLGVSESHASNLRKVWDRFGLPHSTVERTNLTFNECYLLASVSKERARQLLANAKKRKRSVTTIHHERRHRDPFVDAREFMLDRRRARKLLRDPKVLEIVRRVLPEPAHDGESVPPDRRRAQEPEFEYVRELSSMEDRLAVMLDQMLDRKLPGKERKAVSDRVGDVRVLLDWMDSHVTTGDRSFEDALDALLAGRAAPEESSRRIGARRRVPPATDQEPAAADEAVATRAKRGSRPPAAERKRRVPPPGGDRAGRPSRRRRAS